MDQLNHQHFEKRLNYYLTMGDKWVQLLKEEKNVSRTEGEIHTTLHRDDHCSFEMDRTINMYSFIHHLRTNHSYHQH